MAKVLAALRGVTKAYPRVLASQDVTIEFLSGEIHALIGENGAGKSTLVKILGGLLKPHAGTVEVNGQAMRFNNPRAALAAGIGIMHQSGSLIETMTVGENLRLGRIYAPRSSAINEPKKEYLPFIQGIPESRLVRDLSPRERQLVEIQRLLLQQVNLLVLDEPTTALSPQESPLLFRQLRALAKDGYAIIVVSHKLPELIANCHRFTVLRKGRVVARMPRSMASTEKIVKLLTDDCAPAQKERQTTVEAPLKSSGQKPLIRFLNLSASPITQYEPPLQDLTLALNRREILGIVGRPGSGAMSVLKILYGEPAQIMSGRIDWGSTDRQAIGFIPAEGTRTGTIGAFSVAENLALRRKQFLRRLGFASWTKRRNDFIHSLIRRFEVKPPDGDVLLGTLSGGNIQRVLLAREIDYAANLLLATTPIAGLDIKSAAFVRSALREKAQTGSCVVVWSDDVDEIVYLSDRVMIFFDGRCIGELKDQQITREAVGLALSGVAPGQPAVKRGVSRHASIN